MTSDILAEFLRGDLRMLKCTVCGTAYGGCDCWTKCRQPGCSWSYQKGEQCRNPAHAATPKEDNPDGN